MVGSAAAVYANNDPVLTACAVARNTDAQIREMMDDFYDAIIDKLVALLEQDSDARPISDDLPALVRTLAATTTMTLHARQRVRRPRRRSRIVRSMRSSGCGWPRCGVARELRSR